MHGIQHALAKSPLLCGLFGTRWLWSTNGRHILRWLPSLSNACFASLTWANWLNIRFGIAFIPGERGGGTPSSCMNFAGSKQVTMIVFDGSEPFLVRGSLRSL